MATSDQPPRINRGDPIKASFLRQLADNMVSRISISGGTVRRIGNSIIITIDKQRRRGDSHWWGIIQTCDYSAGTATVERATGTLGSLAEVDDTPTVTVYMGPGSWYIVGDEVVVKKSPSGVTPDYFVEQPPLFARHWTPPTGGELADDQDDPSAVTSCS